MFLQILLEGKCNDEFIGMNAPVDCIVNCVAEMITNNQIPNHYVNKLHNNGFELCICNDG